MFRFEELDMWQKAIEFADSVYQASKGFPPDERFALTNQMRRASVSISSNIAEGSSRASRKDLARFVEIAYGWLMETMSQMHVAKRRAFRTQAPFQEVYGRSEQLARMLSGLRSRLVQDNR